MIIVLCIIATGGSCRLRCIKKSNALRFGGHPTEKPLDLMRWCISKADNPASCVDVYAGSGTTLVACKERGIRCFGVEIVEEFCEVAVRRLSQEVMVF